MTGWTLPTIAALTFPQLLLILRGSGPILYPRLRPQLDAQFSNLSSKPEKPGMETDTGKVIREDAERRAALARGETPRPTPEQAERAEAYRILHAYYLAQPAPPPPPAAEPIAGLPSSTARAIVAYAEAGGFAAQPVIWARDVIPWWRQIQATAAQGTP